MRRSEEGFMVEVARRQWTTTLQRDRNPWGGVLNHYNCRREVPLCEHAELKVGTMARIKNL